MSKVIEIDVYIILVFSGGSISLRDDFALGFDTFRSDSSFSKESTEYFKIKYYVFEYLSLNHCGRYFLRKIEIKVSDVTIKGLMSVHVLIFIQKI